MMKMFVWRNVLTDYTNGIAIAMARTEKEARKVILRDAPDFAQEELTRDIAGPPDHIYDKPHGVHCWGGG